MIVALLVAVIVAATLAMLALTWNAGRRGAAPAIEAATDQAVAGELTAEGAAETAARAEIYHQQSAQALAALARLSAEAAQSEDADAPLDPGRAARLAAHDQRLCATPDFHGCAVATGGDAAGR
jgi:hypothetical protein